MSARDGHLRLERKQKDMADKVIRIKSGRIESIETNDNPKAIEEIEW